MSAQIAEKQTMTSSTFDVYCKKDKDFKTVDLHSHDFCEVYYFLSGSARYVIEDCKYSLMPGDILIIPPNKLHQLDIKDSSKAYERFVLWLNKDYIKKISTQKTDLNTCFLFAEEHSAYLIRNSSVSKKVEKALSDVSATKEVAFGNDVKDEEKIKSILVTLGQFFLSGEEEFAVYGIGNVCVSRAIEYISEHINEELSLDAISAAVFVNKYYFAHLFKEVTNTSPHRYVLKKRLILSKQYIEEGLPITGVYTQCGFIDYTHFLRAFKKEFGITPKQFYLSIKR